MLSAYRSSRELLNLIGTDTRRPESDAPVNLYRHREPLVDALRLASEVETRLLASGRCRGMDAEEVYGLRFFVWGVEGPAGELPSSSALGVVVLRVAVEFELAARLLTSGDGGRLWGDLRTRSMARGLAIGLRSLRVS
jgi:hypothetical protein